MPDRGATSDETTTKSDVGSKQKNFLDPIRDVKKYLGCEHESLSLQSVKKDKKRSLKRKLFIQ